MEIVEKPCVQKPAIQLPLIAIYLPLGTFRHRAVRSGCIADYASSILSTLRGLVKCIVDLSNGRSLQYL